MPAKQLPLIQLGDHANYDLYQAKFAEIFGATTVVDPLGRHLYLPPNACEHICLKPRTSDPGFVSIIASWQQPRAERMGWIVEAIRDPDEIRPNHQYPKSGKEAYLLNVMPTGPAPLLAEFFYVTVQVERVLTDKFRVILLSAFPISSGYWRDARRGGKPLYKRGDKV